MILFDLVVLAVLGFGIYRGFCSGFIMQMAYLIAFILGALFAGTLSAYILPHLDSLFYTAYNKPLTFLLTFAAIVTGIIFAGKALTETLKIILLNLPNRIAGAVFGFCKSLFLISIVINLYALFYKKPDNGIRKQERQSTTYEVVKSIAPKIIPYLESQKQD